jgi:2-methylisocitrate lyase-like PEP mutase family enzyme
MAGKIKAAVDTRRDESLSIIARTDARAMEGLQAAIDRMHIYLEAGADIAFVEAPQSVDELAQVGRELQKAAMANIFEGGKTPAIAAAKLEAMWFQARIYRHRRIARRFSQLKKYWKSCAATVTRK